MRWLFRFISSRVRTFAREAHLRPFARRRVGVFSRIFLLTALAACGAKVAVAQTRFSERRVFIPAGAEFPWRFSPDSRLLAMPSDAQDVELWSLKEGRVVATLAHPDGPNAETQLTGLWFLGDGRTLAASFQGGRGQTQLNELAFFDVESGKHRASVEFGNLILPTGLAFSPDGARFAMAIRSGPSDKRVEVSLWDVATASKLKQLDAAPSCVDVKFSPDGKWLATIHGVSLAKGELILWDAATLEKRRSLRAGGNNLYLAFSPDSKLLAAGINRGEGPPKPQAGVRVWDVETGKERVWLEGYTAAPRAQAFTTPLFAPDSRFLVAVYSSSGSHEVGGYLGQIRLANTATGEQSVIDQGGFSGHNGIFAAFSPDGTLLATGAASNTPITVTGADKRSVKLWDTKYWRLLRTLPMSTANKTARPWPLTPGAIFSPDGKWLVTALSVTNGSTYEFFLWDASEFSGRAPLSEGVKSGM